MSIFDERLSIIMPAYNEGEYIHDNLLETVEIINTFHHNFEVVAVNDGSKDDTEIEIRRAAEKDKHIIMVSYMPNGGKGKAIKEGVLRARGQYIAFLDADLDLSPIHLKFFLRKMESTKLAAVIGSKLHKESEVKYPRRRKIMSVGYYLMLVILFHLPVKDTQTGVKLFRADCLKQVIGQVHSTGFAYDIEILAHISESGGEIAEMPIKLKFQRENRWGRIQMKDIWMVAKDTLTLYVSMRRKRYILNEKTTGI